jgi:uncharacterized protein (TIGR03118 family)
MIRSSLITRDERQLATFATDISKATNVTKRLCRYAAVTSLIGALACAPNVASAVGFVETDLVSNQQTLTDANGIVHHPMVVDLNLVNPWGVGESASSPFWVSDNGAGVATLYNTQGTPLARVVSIPAPGDPLGKGGTPTGLVFNIAQAQNAFMISGVTSGGIPTTLPAVFLFATEDGTILGWNPQVNPMDFDPMKAGTYAIIAVDNSPSGAVYKGLAITDVDGNPMLYVTNFHAGTIEAYDGSFAPPKNPPADAFVDPRLQRGYAPFNIVPIIANNTTELFVTYAVQDADKHDDVAGQGHGIVDTFGLDGRMLARFAQHGQLDSPWGMTLAPPSFGEFAGDLLIGNFGNGHINAYDPVSGEFINKVRNPHGQAIVIDGLWTIRLGNGGNGGDQNTLYFTAGPNGESDGLFGSLAPSP